MINWNSQLTRQNLSCYRNKQCLNTLLPLKLLKFTFIYWWAITVTLVVTFGFCSKTFGGDRDLQIVILFENERSLSCVDNHKWLAYSNPTSWQTILNYMHSQVVWTQKIVIFPTSPALLHSANTSVISPLLPELIQV